MLTWTPTVPPCPTGQRHSQLAGLYLQFFLRHGLCAARKKKCLFCVTLAVQADLYSLLRRISKTKAPPFFFSSWDAPLASRTKTLSCGFLFCSLRAALSPDSPAPTTTTSNWFSLIPVAVWANSAIKSVAQANRTPRLSCGETAKPRKLKVRLYYAHLLLPSMNLALRPNKADRWLWWDTDTGR